MGAVCKNTIDGVKCKNRADYGEVPGKRLYCKSCKEKYFPELHPISNPCYAYCKHNIVCWKSPVFVNREGDRYCRLHKEEYGDETFVPIKNSSPKCVDCKVKVARYRPSKSSTVTLYCGECRKNHPGAVNNRGLCKYGDCVKYASFNHDGFKPEYCADHMEKGMVNVHEKKCEDCGATATYGPPGRKKTHCAKHADKGKMTSIRQCAIEGCVKRASYTDEPNSKKRKFCPFHRGPDDYNVELYCTTEGCFRRAQYGVGGQTKCFDHHDPETMSFRPNENMCKAEGCHKRATHGEFFKKKVHCAEHRVQGKEFLFNNPKCEIEGCKETPFYSDQNYPMRCDEHKLDCDKTTILRECSNCHNFNFIMDGETFCDTCSTHTKNEGRKEYKMKAYLESQGYNFTHDKVVTYGCSLKRPDILIELNYYNVIVECDEYQHKDGNYTEACEIRRMKQIYWDLCSDAYCIFIRFNPDPYKPSNKFEKKDTISVRYEMLGKLLEMIKTNDELRKFPKGKLSVYYLYYDGFDKNNIEPIYLNPYEI